MSLVPRPLSLTVNGQAVGPMDVPEGMPMIDFLHEYLNLTGSRLGCGIGECRACTVIVDGPEGSREMRTCITGVHYFQGRKVRTIEGIADPAGADTAPRPRPAPRASRARSSPSAPCSRSTWSISASSAATARRASSSRPRCWSSAWPRRPSTRPMWNRSWARRCSPTCAAAPLCALLRGREGPGPEHARADLERMSAMSAADPSTATAAPPADYSGTRPRHRAGPGAAGAGCCSSSCCWPCCLPLPPSGATGPMCRSASRRPCTAAPAVGPGPVSGARRQLHGLP